MSTIKFKPENQVAYDKEPICFKVRSGVKPKLKNVPSWQKRLRDYVEQLIAESGQTGSDG